MIFIIQENVNAVKEDPFQLREEQWIKQVYIVLCQYSILIKCYVVSILTVSCCIFIFCEQTSLTELEIPLKLKWKRGQYMPLGMANSQAVVIDANVYIGGGGSRGTMLVYKILTGSWEILPPYENRFFGIAAMNNQLVLVGGRNLSSGRTDNVLGVWDEGSQTWTHPFSEMPTSRHSTSVVSYQRWLVVAGGIDGSGSYVTKVELLDTHSKQWYEGSPLPKECSLISSTIDENVWFLLNGHSFRQANKHVFSVCLDELISQAVSSSTGVISPSTPSPWQTLTDTPSTNSTLLILNRALLAVGGYRSSAIHLYQPSSRSWIKVSDLPAKLSRCACVVLPSGEIFVAGGQNDEGQYSCLTDSVNIGTIHHVK